MISVKEKCIQRVLMWICQKKLVLSGGKTLGKTSKV